MPNPKTGVTTIANSSNSNNLDVTRNSKIETVAKEGATVIVNLQNDVFLQIEDGPVYRLDWQVITVAGAAPIGADDARAKIEVLLTVPGTAAGAGGATEVQGDFASNAVDGGKPVKTGFTAEHFGPLELVAQGDRRNSSGLTTGQLWVIAGSANIITKEFTFTAAQANVALVTVPAGSIIVTTMIDVTIDNATSVDVGVRVGYAAATLDAPAAGGVTGILLSHAGVSAGSGVVKGSGAAVIGIGADGEDMRITCEVPTGGSIRILVTYFTTSLS